jgi:hypothetical protein
MKKLLSNWKQFLNESIEVKGDKLKSKLLPFGGENVKLGLDTDEELDRMLNDGFLFNVDVVNLKGGFGQCHRNVADKSSSSAPHPQYSLL